MNYYKYVERLQKYNVPSDIIQKYWNDYHMTKTKYMEYIADNGLTSCMNNTKWNELINAINDELPFCPPYDLKLIFEEDDSKFYRAVQSKSLCCADCYDDETFNDFGNYLIEWIKILPRYWERVGGQLYYRLVEHSCEKEFLKVLHKYSIPYEYRDGIYTIYGYKRR